MAVHKVKKLGGGYGDIYELVKTNDKKRLELKKEDVWLIRAVQGHTMKAVKDEELLETMHADPAQ